VLPAPRLHGFPTRRGVPALPIGAFALLAALLTGPAPVAAADVRDDAIATGMRAALAPLESLSLTGVLYDRVLPLAHVESLDGGAAAPAITGATWRQAYDELRRASLAPPAGPDLDALDGDARASLRRGVIPLALLDRAYERVRPGALEDGSLRMTGGRVEPVGGAPLIESRAVAFAALAPRTYRGANVLFALDQSRFFSDDAAPPRALTVDFGDGDGPRPIALGERVTVSYSEPGTRTLRLRLERADGSVSEARAAFEVAALATPAPNDTLHITATTPYFGQYGTGDAYVYLAPGHLALVNPAVVIEGFDLDNSMNWDELYALLNQQNLLEDLRADGFDAVVLNFTDATDAIQKNSYVVAELIQQVQAMVSPTSTLALVGASMGGLCSRYALAYMEKHAMPHRVRTWISFDGAQAGADIPLGLQYWIRFFSGQSAAAAAFQTILQRPAARQMLLYHFTNPAQASPTADPARDSLATDLAAIGGYPALTRRVAMSNGSGTMVNQGFNAGDQLIQYVYSSAFVAITGNVWAVPNISSRKIFDGSIRIILSTTSQAVTVSGTQPWDGAPGGWRASLAELDSTTATYGDIVALHPNHCFIPTVSSLALATTDPFFDVAGAPDLLALTPFDAVYYPTLNQEHVLITAENAVWVKNEVEVGVLAVGPEGAAARAVTLSPGRPNPFRVALQLSFTLPQAGLADLRVFGVDGREVRRLLHERRGPGTHTACWDGRDARGARAPAGIYFMRLAAAGGAATRRVVKLD